MTDPDEGVAPWSDMDVLELGQMVCSLVLDSQSWMHRRVERLTMDDNGSTRLHVSVDYTLDREIRGSKDRVLLPLGFVRKGALAGLDTTGPDGKVAPVLESTANGRLSAAMLLWMAFRVLPPGLHNERLWQHLHDVAHAAPDDAETAYLRYLAARRAHPEVTGGPALDTFEAVVQQLAQNFLLVVEVPVGLVGTRCVTKYSYERERPRVTRDDVPATAVTEASQFGLARSWHFEVEAPVGLGIRRLEVEELEGDEPTGRMWVDEPSGREPLVVSHVACRSGGRFTTARVVITLMPQRRGVPWVSVVGALVVLGLAAGMVVERLGWIDLVRSNTAGTSPAASILLAGPALLLSWFARGPEHVLVARLLRRVRRPVLMTTATLFGGALLVAVPFVSWLATTGWIVLLAFQSAAAWNAVRWLRVVSGRTYGHDNETKGGS